MSTVVTELKGGASLRMFVLSSLLASACLDLGSEASGSSASNVPMTELEIQCDQYCQKEATLGCANSISAEGCTQECVFLGEMHPNCEAEYNAMNQCKANANLICDALGNPDAGEACYDLLDAHGQCVASQ
jgi:hypothetical protein